MPRNPPEKTARPAARHAGRRGEFPPISVQVYRQLRNAIIQGKINPGERLSELEIAVQYETSRQPVREAFIKLAEECLVRILPQRGTFVVKISVAEVMDARFVREAIEIAVVMKAAASASLSAIQALRVLIEKQAAIQAGHNIEFYALDDEFHRALALSAGHAYAWRVLESIKAQMDRVRYLSLDDATPIPLLIEQHRRIVDGIEAGDPTVAAAAMRNHLREITLSLPAIAGHFPELFQAD
jgi:DNA-binding GntR family transcriptional regulator